MNARSRKKWGKKNGGERGIRTLGTRQAYKYMIFLAL